MFTYVWEKVGEWARDEWVTDGGISRAITQELCGDDKLCMEIFEGPFQKSRYGSSPKKRSGLPNSASNHVALHNRGSHTHWRCSVPPHIRCE